MFSIGFLSALALSAGLLSAGLGGASKAEAAASCVKRPYLFDDIVRTNCATAKTVHGKLSEDKPLPKGWNCSVHGLSAPYGKCTKGKGKSKKSFDYRYVG